jgi:hypothetical protein
VAAPQRLFAAGVGLLHQRLGQLREREQRVLDRRKAQQVARADAQQLAPLREPEEVQLGLVRRMAPQAGERLQQVVLDVHACAFLAQRLGLGQRVEPGRVADQRLGQERAAAERHREQLGGARPLAQHSEQPRRLRVHVEEALEADQPALGVGRRREPLEHMRQQREDVALRGLAGRHRRTSREPRTDLRCRSRARTPTGAAAAGSRRLRSCACTRSTSR